MLARLIHVTDFFKPMLDEIVFHGGKVGDYHVHLRQGELMQLVVPHLRASGVQRCLVMPNLEPPILCAADAVRYHAELQALAPNMEFMMTLYLTAKTSVALIKEAAKVRTSDGRRLVTGFKWYPKGATTKSEHGLSSYKQLSPEVFATMVDEDFVLHIHGEAICACRSGTIERARVMASVPKPHGPHAEDQATRDLATNQDVNGDQDGPQSTLDAEEAFLDTLREVVRLYPRLRIVLEHITTSAAARFIEQQSQPSRVACTITPHHLVLTLDDALGDPFSFCKPVPKFPRDRAALVQLLGRRLPHVFLGSDTAPHPLTDKIGLAGHQAYRPLPGIYHGPHVLPLLATLFEAHGLLDGLNDFVVTNGERFFGPSLLDKPLLRMDQEQQRLVDELCTTKGPTVDQKRLPRTIKLQRRPTRIPAVYEAQGTGLQVVPFWAGRELPWCLEEESDDR